MADDDSVTDDDDGTGGWQPPPENQATLRDLWGVLREDELPNETKLFVALPDGKGGLDEVPIMDISWSKTSWGDDKLIFDTTD